VLFQFLGFVKLSAFFVILLFSLLKTQLYIIQIFLKVKHTLTFPFFFCSLASLNSLIQSKLLLMVIKLFLSLRFFFLSNSFLLFFLHSFPYFDKMVQISFRYRFNVLLDSFILFESRCILLNFSLKELLVTFVHGWSNCSDTIWSRRRKHFICCGYIGFALTVMLEILYYKPHFVPPSLLIILQSQFSDLIGCLGVGYR
jgi:hypothetical protein